MQEYNKNNLFWILLGIGLISILVLTTPTSEAGLFNNGFIPPTPSFSTLNTTGSSIISGAYNEFIEFIAGTGMSISMNDITNEVTFSTTAGGGNVIGEGIQGRIAIWNDTTKINSTATALAWDWNTNTLNIANGHFFNSTYYNIGSNKITGSMTCINGQVIQYNSATNVWECLTLSASGEANTASNIGTDTGIFKEKVGVDLRFKSIRAGSNIIFTNYDNEILINATSSGGATTMESLSNVTDIGCALNQGLTVNSSAQWDCANVGFGNATILNDLGDVIISGSAIDHILQHDGSTYINKKFKADTDLNTTNSNNITFLTGFDNQTGDFTRKIFSVNNQTALPNFQITGINNQTGIITRNEFSIDSSLNTTNTNNISFVTGFNNQTGDVTRKIFTIDTTTCSGTNKVSAINNQTGVITCATDQTGAAGGSGIPKPPQKKFGSFMPISTAITVGIGLFAATATGDGTESFQYNTTHNANAIRTISGSVAGNNAGIAWLGTDIDHYRGDQNSYMYSKFVTDGITSNRLFVGFHSGTTQMPNNNDSVCLNVSCVGLCVNTTSTVYNFCHNDGDATTNDDSFAVTEAANTVHYVEIYTTNSGVTWCGKMDGGTEVCSSIEIPAVTTRLRSTTNIETSVASAHTIWYYHVYTENDR